MNPPRGAEWALLGGNFSIGCGVLVVTSCLNDLVRGLDVSVPVGGQLITTAAVAMCFGAPLLAALMAGWDRRRLLTLALLWFGAGHAVSALMTSYAALLPVRALTVLGAAVFTPQAAAALGVMMPAERRGRAITFVFLGWSLASVVGMPMHSFVGEVFGWRWAFALVAMLSFAAALAVWHAMPDGVRPPALSLANWHHVLTDPVLMGMVLVTALAGAGQITVFSYLAPFGRQELGASAGELSLLFMWFGAFGLIGNLLLSQRIDRLGPARAVLITLVLMAASLAAWPLAQSVTTMAIVLVPWALGSFASNSAQQVRASRANPELASALIALNSSAIYFGHAIGTASGGAVVAEAGYGALSGIGLAWILSAIVLSTWVARRMRGPHDV